MSRFGLRKRMKKMLGMVDPPQKSAPPSSASTATNQRPVMTSKSVESTSPNTKTSSEPVTTKPDVSQPTSEQDEKILKHRRRTKIALLKLTMKSEGTAPLSDLHDLAEKRYFIAHKAFSDLMEEMVSEGLFLYDWSAGEATITELGQEWMKTDVKRGKNGST